MKPNIKEKIKDVYNEETKQGISVNISDSIVSELEELSGLIDCTVDQIVNYVLSDFVAKCKVSDEQLKTINNISVNVGLLTIDDITPEDPK